MDALIQPWSWANLWANPPWILIPRILAKVIREKATITLVAPLWESAPWFPLLLDLLVAPPIQLRSPAPLVPSPVHQQPPLRNPQWKVFVSKISGHGMKRKAFLSKLSTFSSQHWIRTLRRRCPRISNNGYLGVATTPLIPLAAL